nr:hypothetical protein [Nitrosomonas nitrosa]
MGKEDTIISRLKQSLISERYEICKALQIPVTSDIYTISKEYRSAAGHSLINIIREDHELPYKMILIDVADKLYPGFFWTDYSFDDDSTEEEIEEEIEKYLSERAQKEWDKLSPLEKKRREEQLKQELVTAGYAQANINSIMTMLASGSIGNILATRAASYLASSAGPSLLGVSSSSFLLSSTGIGLLISIPLLIGTLGGPAYRKTILATIQMIRIRRRVEAEALL